MVHVANNSGNNEWYTPEKYICAVRQVLGEIDLDPASCELANGFVQAKMYYDIDTNGLSKKWFGKVFMNPPYSGKLVGLFCDKLIAEVQKGNVKEAVVLVNNATETLWFFKMSMVANAFAFPRGRIRYLDSEGLPSKTPLQGQVFIYIGKNVDKFIEVFSKFGWTAKGVNRE